MYMHFERIFSYKKVNCYVFTRSSWDLSYVLLSMLVYYKIYIICIYLYTSTYAIFHLKTEKESFIAPNEFPTFFFSLVSSYFTIPFNLS